MARLARFGKACFGAAGRVRCGWVRRGLARLGVAGKVRRG